MVTDNRRQYQRRRTFAQWTSENPVLSAGEIGVATGGQAPEIRVGDGTSGWSSLLGPDITHPAIFYQHPTNVTIPNNTWTPLPWNTIRAQVGTWTTYAAASTTIAAGSNGAALPQATINVASAASFLSSGYLVITIGGTHRVVRYTGKTATTFTGCTLGVGTMTTGDAVAQANVIWTPPPLTLAPMVAEVAWASNATGLRGIRVRFVDGVFNPVGGTTVVGAVATTPELFHIQTGEQPATTPSSPALTPLVGTAIEVFQTSGGNLDSVASGNLDSPRLVAAVTSAFH